MISKMKGRPFKEQASYFWTYYKWHTIIAILLLSYIIYGICAVTGKKESVLNGIFLDSYEKGNMVEELANDFVKIVPIDTKKEEFSFRTDLFYDMPKVTMRTKYATNQVISSQTMNGKLDFIISDTATLTSFAQRTMLMDLSSFFSEEELLLLESYLIYVDKADLKEPVPMLLDMSECERIQELYTYTDETIALGIAQNIPHPETTKKFLAYLLQ